MTKIYLSPPHMGGKEFEFVKDAFESNWIAPLGPHVDGFEREMAAFVGVKAAAATNSGTAALHLALRLVGVSDGDEVLCSSLTFCASATPVRYLGAKPVFVDSDRATWCLDPDLVEEALAKRARSGRLPAAVIAVDIYGQCADYERLQAMCENYGVPLVEDAAEALGATYRGARAGSFGKCAVLSFNGNKIITTSGGGMLISNDSELVESARFLSTQARDPQPHYQHSTIGYNYRLSNLLAAVGRGQLQVLEERVAQKRRIFDYYETHLGDLSGLTMMPESTKGKSSRWLSCVLLDPDGFGASSEQVRLALAHRDIEARPLWKPMHLQPVFADFEVLGGGVSEKLFERGLCLPSGTALSEAELSQIVEIIRECHRG